MMLSIHPRSSSGRVFRRILLAFSFALASGPATRAGLPGGFPPLTDLTPAGLGPREPDLFVEFPGGAAGRGISHGTATVAVLVDADGKARDFLITSYTDKVFGTALLEFLQTRDFAPAKLKRTQIPSRCGVTYQFHNRQTTRMDVMDATREMSNRRGPPVAYEAVSEGKLDHPLQLTAVQIPKLPKTYPVKNGEQVKVFVTFFVDEDGHVRIPNVESAPSPRVVAPALGALLQWSFAPPTSHGKPVLVFASRGLTFDPAEAPAATPPDTSPKK